MTTLISSISEFTLDNARGARVPPGVERVRESAVLLRTLSAGGLDLHHGVPFPRGTARSCRFLKLQWNVLHPFHAVVSFGIDFTRIEIKGGES